MVKKPAAKPVEGSQEVKADEVKVAKAEETTATPKKEEVSKHLGELVKKGEFVLADVFGKVKNGRAFYATNKMDAIREKIYEEKKQYTPELVVIGEKGFLFDTITEDMEKGTWKVGDQKTFDLTAEQAFGKRDGSKLRQMGVREFKKKTGKDAKLGEEYRDAKSGERGYVIRLNQGRALIDLNHPLAGKEITYVVKVVDKMTEEKEILNSFLVKNGPGINPELFKITRKDKDIEIEIPQAYMWSNLMYFKLNVGLEMTRYLPNVERVRFIETIEKIPETKSDSDHGHEHDHKTEKAEKKPAKKAARKKTSSHTESAKSGESAKDASTDKADEETKTKE
ncbi:MAG: peptidylprolyl isomerase, FKBP-type [Promethearchaeota archaeon CR_4]|nr:MAG: peptidylprolyl isomerase, FKBP-type [Candidatus Lokiarchaeota archaeon CR_4]